MIDIFTVYRVSTEMMRKYKGVRIMFDYCPICSVMRLDLCFDKLEIFAYYECKVKTLDDALTTLYTHFYDFILQPEIVKYWREESNNDHNC